MPLIIPAVRSDNQKIKSEIFINQKPVLMVFLLEINMVSSPKTCINGFFVGDKYGFILFREDKIGGCEQNNCIDSDGCTHCMCNCDVSSMGIFIYCWN